MMRRQFLIGGAAAAGLGLGGAGGPARANDRDWVPGYRAGVDDNGLHSQPWFHQGFLNLAEDLEEAAAAGKRLAIFWEQKGCPYCREMHVRNLALKPINDFIRKHFLVVQLNLWGSREATDFDGRTMEEKALARRWRVNFTPTVNFFPATPAEVAGRPGREAEAARMPGYLKPAHFLTYMEFVVDEGYRTQSFQRYLMAKFRAIHDSGRDPFRLDKLTRPRS